MGFSDYQSAWVGEADRARLIREAISGLPYAWTTLWARFDYGQVVLPQWTYNLWAVIVGACLVGLIRLRQQLRMTGMAIVGLAILLALAGWGVLMVTIPATAHARHILYAFPAIGLLFTLGWSGLFPANRPRLFNSGILGFGLLQITFSLYALFAYLAPAFAYPETVTSLPPGVTPASSNFEGAAEIVGYQVTNSTPKPGEQVDVMVYWKPLAQTASPLQVFVHFVDDEGIIAAQRDTYPGLGNAVTTTWLAGEVFVDAYRVYIPETADAPHPLTIRVGLWSGAEGRPLITGNSDALELGTIQLQGTRGQSALGNEIDFNFDNTMQLVGYSVDKRVLKPGDTLQLQTYWQIDSRLDTLYWASAHIVGNDGQIWGLADSLILPFTSEWKSDEVNGETRPISLDQNTPPGQYILEFGILEATKTSQYRLPIIDVDGQGLGDQIELARIKVEP